MRSYPLTISAPKSPEANAVLADSTQWRCFRSVIPSVLVKHRKTKIANTATKNRVTIRASLRSWFNHTHCRSPDRARYVSCYRSFGKFYLRIAKLVGLGDSISPAISFFRETSGPSTPQGKFPAFGPSLPRIVRRVRAAGLLSVFQPATHS